MDTNEAKAVTVEKKRQVKFTFTGLVAKVNVNGSDKTEIFDIAPLSDEIKLELIQYGLKQKLSDFRANDLLRGDEKISAMIECYEMLEAGNFRQTRTKAESMSIEDQLIAWSEMSDAEKQIVKSVAPEKFAKLERLSQ